jgi:DNA polymerase-4
MIFHLDLDAFFISVERILDPSLEGKPVIVGADPRVDAHGQPHGRGVVAACSYETREFGVRSGIPVRQACQLCPTGLFIHGSHKEYSRFSRAVKNILERYAPVLEQASIDEFYLDFTGCERIYGHPYFFASRIQAEIKRELHLPCSIGIASNKFVAKVASDYAKPEGITFVLPGQEVEFLSPLPVERMPGVGEVTQRELNARGFYTIGQIANTSSEYFQIVFGKWGKAIHDHALGKGTEFLIPHDERHEQKSISREETYGTDTTDKRVVEKTLFELVEDVCDSLRKENWMASKVGIKLRYSDFVTLTREKTLSSPTNDDKIIYETAVELFRKAYTRRVSVRLIGVRLTKFCEFSEQEILFPTIEDKRQKLLKSIDRIRTKYGMEIVRYGVT